MRPEIKSLAVLPLQNLSGDPAQEYFADGMTEALISSLAQIRALRVISRTSVMSFKGTKKPLPPLPEIARAAKSGRCHRRFGATGERAGEGDDPTDSWADRNALCGRAITSAR